MSFKGIGKRIDDVDLPILAMEYGIGEDEVHAVLDAESAGKGFDQHGRPKMLFEPHIFWKLLGPGPQRDEAARQGIAYAKWKPGAYPEDSYPRLLKAISINYEIALRSASWGLGQIMGFNYAAAGYGTAHGMVMDFLDDEEMHLRAMFRFIWDKGLDKYLRQRNWKAFAAGYNGPGFAKNGYDKKLAERFAHWQKIKDTPIPADYVRKPAKVEPDVADMAARVAAVKKQERPKPPPIAPALIGVGVITAVTAWWSEITDKVSHWVDVLAFWN